jgi:hypothetical protein
MPKCARGIDALKLYRAEYDDKLQALRPRPVHDWTSHAADSFRYLALTLDRRRTQASIAASNIRSKAWCDGERPAHASHNWRPPAKAGGAIFQRPVVMSPRLRA